MNMVETAIALLREHDGWSFTKDCYYSEAKHRASGIRLRKWHGWSLILPTGGEVRLGFWSGWRIGSAVEAAKQAKARDLMRDAVDKTIAEREANVLKLRAQA